MNDDDDDLIDWKRLRKKIPWSRAHVARLEAAGRFPLRVKLGQGRVAWVLGEIRAHVRKLVEERGTLPKGTDDFSE
jgi:prophage regulatory protein